MASKSAQRWVNCLLVVVVCLGALPAPIQAASPAVMPMSSDAQETAEPIQPGPFLGPA